MIGARGLELGAWGLVVTGVLSIGWTARTPIAEAPDNDSYRPLPPVTAHYRPYPAESLARAIGARPVFRAGRRATTVAYDPARAGQLVVPEVRLPKPTLVLVGVVAGADPTAVIEGFPGAEGARVVRAGDVIAGLTIRRIGGRDVRVAGMDTVWTLTVREPWKPE